MIGLDLLGVRLHPLVDCVERGRALERALGDTYTTPGGYERRPAKGWSQAQPVVGDANTAAAVNAPWMDLDKIKGYLAVSPMSKVQATTFIGAGKKATDYAYTLVSSGPFFATQGEVKSIADGLDALSLRMQFTTDPVDANFAQAVRNGVYAAFEKAAEVTKTATTDYQILKDAPYDIMKGLTGALADAAKGATAGLWSSLWPLFVGAAVLVAGGGAYLLMRRR